MNLNMKKTIRKMNKRQLQAIDTHQKILKTALSLMTKYGYSNVTIRDICKEADVAIGTFYIYFKSKGDIFSTMYNEADAYFSKEVFNTINKHNGSAIDKIVEFFVQYAKYNESTGLDGVRLLYNSENKWFVIKGRQMQEVLKNIILSCQEAGDLTDKMSAQQMTEWMFIAARGVVYDWCLHDGKYDLQQFIAEYFKVFIKSFINEN